MLAWLKRALATTKARAAVYGLDHAVLNVRVPPESMWMNMGYWEHTSDFPQACRALLDQVLAAGLLSDESRGCVRVVDVGCGCGDQSLHILQLNQNRSDSPASALASAVDAASGPPSLEDDDGDDEKKSLRSRHNGKSNRLADSARPLIDSYIGITLEPAQAALARRRVREHSRHDGFENSSTGLPADIFCADAADPTCWTGDLQHAVTAVAAPSAADDGTTWLLALDTMYHFRPSRLPLLRYAQTTLHASLMAFDLVLADGVSWRDRLLLRLVCWVTGAPFGNFVSCREYERMLLAAGYDPAQIQIRDISRHVFTGLSAFLDRRVKEATPLGFRMGKFRAARLVFDWWARSGVVKGVVVVARRKRS